MTAILTLLLATGVQPSAAAAALPPTACPRGTEEVVVCAPRPADTHRLPAEPGGYDPHGMIDSAATERFRLIDVGASGIGSCSASGPGGFTGCKLREWRYDELQNKQPGGAKPRVTLGPIRP